MNTTTKVWVHSVVAAFIAGGATAAVTLLQSPTLDVSAVVKSFLVAGAIGVLLLLKQSPLPPDGKDTTGVNK